MLVKPFLMNIHLQQVFMTFWRIVWIRHYVKGTLRKKDFKKARKIADVVFLQGMEATEPLVAKWKKWSAYYAVRMFGWSAIKSSAKRTW